LELPSRWPESSLANGAGANNFGGEKIQALGNLKMLSVRSALENPWNTGSSETVEFYNVLVNPVLV
jgi:hypothetical protein